MSQINNCWNCRGRCAVCLLDTPCDSWPFLPSRLFLMWRAQAWWHRVALEKWKKWRLVWATIKPNYIQSSCRGGLLVPFAAFMKQPYLMPLTFVWLRNKQNICCSHFINVNTSCGNCQPFFHINKQHLTFKKDTHW